MLSNPLVVVLKQTLGCGPRQKTNCETCKEEEVTSWPGVEIAGPCAEVGTHAVHCWELRTEGVWPQEVRKWKSLERPKSSVLDA